MSEKYKEFDLYKDVQDKKEIEQRYALFNKEIEKIHSKILLLEQAKEGAEKILKELIEKEDVSKKRASSWSYQADYRKPRPAG